MLKCKKNKHRKQFRKIKFFLKIFLKTFFIFSKSFFKSGKTVTLQLITLLYLTQILIINYKYYKYQMCQLCQDFPVVPKYYLNQILKSIEI